MAATAVRADLPAGGAREAPATGPLAAPTIARLVGFVPLALFGALHWGGLLAPGAGGTMVVGVIVVAAAGALLVRTSPDPRHAVRAGGALAAVFGMALTGLLLAGVPTHLLAPRDWDELAGGIAQGMESLPAITVPYRGADEWVRSALVLSGMALTGFAVLLAFWPRRRAPTPGFPIAAAVALGALYTIPIVERAPHSPYLGGAMFCVLLAMFLWLERLRADHVGVAILCVVAVTIAGALVAPRLGRGSEHEQARVAQEVQAPAVGDDRVEGAAPGRPHELAGDRAQRGRRAPREVRVEDEVAHHDGGARDLAARVVGPAHPS